MRQSAVIVGAPGGIGISLVAATIASRSFSVVHAVARKESRAC